MSQTLIATDAAHQNGQEYEASVATTLRTYVEYSQDYTDRTITLPRPALTYKDQTIITDGWIPALRTYVEVKGGGEDSLGSAYQKWYYHLYLITTGVYRTAQHGGLFGDTPCGFLLVLAGDASLSVHVNRFFDAWNLSARLFPQEFRYAWCVREQDLSRDLLQTIHDTVLPGYPTR